MKAWIAAFRLKTLPLALGAIILGSSLNPMHFEVVIFSWAALTAVLLQILSNLANDYGDFVKGTDKHRLDRQLAGGNISKRAMEWAMGIFVVFCLASGISLLTEAFGTNKQLWFTFLGIGVLSILAAIAYTVGKKAYGYHGLGDVFVFLFFGLVGVVGSSFLFKQTVEAYHWFAAIAYGCLSVGVLNINNLRDLDKDIIAGKITLASKMGGEGALTYQGALFVIALIAVLCHHFLLSYLSLAPIGIAIVGYVNLQRLKGAETSQDYNQQLKFLSLSTLGIVLLFILKFHY